MLGLTTDKQNAIGEKVSLLKGREDEWSYTMKSFPVTLLADLKDGCLAAEVISHPDPQVSNLNKDEGETTTPPNLLLDIILSDWVRRPQFCHEYAVCLTIDCSYIGHRALDWKHLSTLTTSISLTRCQLSTAIWCLNLSHRSPPFLQMQQLWAPLRYLPQRACHLLIQNTFLGSERNS